MSIGTTAAIVAGVGAAGSLAGGALKANAAGNAANAQATAASNAQQLQQQEAANSLSVANQQYGIQQQNLAPYQAAGTQALGKLNTMSPFAAPTAVTEQNDPGYQFRLQQGQKALENSAASRGSLLSGGTAKSLQDYAQGEASNEYGNVYNRALQTYGTNLNTQFGLAGIGQNATNAANASSQNLANQTAAINMQTGAQQGQDINNAAAARASGYVGGANAVGGAIGGLSNDVTQGLLLGNVLQQPAQQAAPYLPTSPATPASGGISNTLLPGVQNPYYNMSGY